MARQYCELEDVENYLLIEVDVTFSLQIVAWIEAMTEYIENYTGRVFEADGAASERKFEVKFKEGELVGRYNIAPRSLQIDECVEVESLSIDDEEVDVEDYLTYPMNSTTKTRIMLKEDTGLYFTEGEQNIVVSAKWGAFESVPAAIKFACTVLVAGIVNNTWSSEGELSSITMGRYTASFKDEKEVKDFENVEKTLDKYRKTTI